MSAHAASASASNRSFALSARFLSPSQAASARTRDFREPDAGDRRARPLGRTVNRARMITVAGCSRIWHSGLTGRKILRSNCIPPSSVGGWARTIPSMPADQTSRGSLLNLEGVQMVGEQTLAPNSGGLGPTPSEPQAGPAAQPPALWRLCWGPGGLGPDASPVSVRARGRA